MSAELLKVPDFLTAMASRWQTQARELPRTLPQVSGSSSQPSAAAMSAVLAGAGTAVARLSARMAISAAKVSLADTRFDDNEAASAAKLRAVGGRVV
jgi:hypothetical protein